MAQSSQSAAIEKVILGLLEKRGPGKTICPSDAARAFDPDGWRARMDEVREVAAGLADAGHVVATQKGEPVDLRTARGPIRLRRT